MADVAREIAEAILSAILRDDATSYADVLAIIAGALDRARAKAHRACPCLHTTPCDPRCTCIDSYSSFGCQRCCSYGSPEQQRSAAERLANARAEALEEAAKYFQDMVGPEWSCTGPNDHDAHAAGFGPECVAAAICALRPAPEEGETETKVQTERRIQCSACEALRTLKANHPIPHDRTPACSTYVTEGTD